MQLLPLPNAFYQTNGERSLMAAGENMIGFDRFLTSQMEMKCIWQYVEEVARRHSDVSVKNAEYFVAQSGVDFKSSVQLIFDVYSQLIEVSFGNG